MTTGLRPGSRVLREAVYYLPTYLIDDKPPNPTGECSLFVRRYRMIELASGKRKLAVLRDVLTFSDADAMVAVIEGHALKELPGEADAQPLFVPVEFRRFKRARVEPEFGRVALS